MGIENLGGGVFCVTQLRIKTKFPYNFSKMITTCSITQKKNPDAEIHNTAIIK